MKAFLRGLLTFLLFVLAAAAVSVWPVLNYLKAGGQFDPQWSPPVPMPPELGIAAAILLAAFFASAVLIIFGITWTLLRSWKPFAITLGSALAINGAIVAFGLLKVGPEWLLGLLFFTVPLSLLALLYSIFLSLRNNLLLITALRLVGATILSAIISILFPFIIIGAGIYLMKKRGIPFREVWSESPQIYNFVITNIYPIFFQILPGLNYVKKKAKEEAKTYQKVERPEFRSRLDTSELRLGDVILTGLDSWANSMPIQASNILSVSEDERFWSHSTIYDGNGKVIEAQSEGIGVVVTDLEQYFNKGYKLRVLRHVYLKGEELQGVVDFCRGKAEEGCPYDTWGVSFYALAALIPPMMSGWLEHPFAEKLFNVKDSYFCSELIAAAFLESGHDVFARRPWRVKPLDFAHTPLFREVDCGFERKSVAETASPA